MRHYLLLLKNGVFSLIIALVLVGTASAQLQWELRKNSLGTVKHTKIAFVNNHFVLNADNKLFSSTDGITWTDLGVNLNCEVSDIIYGNKGYVVACRNGAIWSSVQLSELKMDTVLFVEGDTSYLNMAVYGDGKYLIGGHANFEDGNRGWVYTRSAAEPTWTKTYTDTTIRYFMDGMYANGQFYAVGPYKMGVLTSEDGVAWTGHLVGSAAYSNLWAIAYGNNRYVALGIRDRPTSIVSSDGINWSVGDSSSLIPYMSIAYGNGYFVISNGALGTGMNLLRGLRISPDGIRWSQVSSTETTHFVSVAFGNDRFIGLTIDGDMYISGEPTSSRSVADINTKSTIGSIGVQNKSLRITLTAQINKKKVAITLTNAIGRQFRIPFTVTPGGTLTAPIGKLPEGWYHVSVKSEQLTLGKSVVVTR